MASISALTQSRLSLLLVDKATNAFVRGVPVYAELRLALEEPPYTIRDTVEFVESETPLKDWAASHAFVLDAINRVIAANVAEADFAAFADKQALYVATLKRIKGRIVDGESLAEKQALVTKETLSFLQRFKLPLTLQENKRTILSFPLGTLASDHAGYLSFDLTSVARRALSLVPSAAFTTTDASFVAYPLAREDLKQDISLQGRLTPESIFGTVRLDNMEEFEPVRLPAMQTPGLEDWYLSPGSFALNPAFFIGADSCENLYPANFATQEFSFFQVVRGTKILIPEERGVVGRPSIFEARAGWCLEYQVSWQPLGHTIGQIVYSLPLAPGEIVKIAVLDWARKSLDSRNEDLTVKEQLAHNTHRDRNISETVDAAMQEWQRGGSFMGGVAASYGGSGYGISGALGGGYSTSSGDRSVHASTVQQISDAFAQASSAIRELRSTIVVQSDQQEHAKAETRVVANHNHSHALTMLYYEVLRHYKVETRFSRVRPTIMVRYPHIDFSAALAPIARYRRILENVLLQASYLPCFDAVQKLLCAEGELARTAAKAAQAPDLNDINELGELKLVIKTKRATGRDVFVDVVTRNRENVPCLLVSPAWDKLVDPRGLEFALPNQVDGDPAIVVGGVVNYRKAGEENVFVVKPFKTVLWKDVDGLQLRVGNNGPDPWDIESVQVVATAGAKV